VTCRPTPVINPLRARDTDTLLFKASVSIPGPRPHTRLLRGTLRSSESNNSGVDAQHV
jgi:hypothetical protein